MLGGPGYQLAHRRRRGCLQPQRRAVLALIAWPAQVHDHRPCNRQRHLGAQILLDQRQREVHARAHAGRGVEVAVARPDAVFRDADPGIAKREVLGARPVRGGGAPVEQARLGQEKGPRADRAEAAHAAGHPADPVEHRTVVEEGVHTAAAHDEQRVDVAAQRAEGDVGEESKAGGCDQRPSIGPDHRERVARMSTPFVAQESGRPGEDLQWTGEVERLDVGICEEGDAEGPGGGGAFHARHRARTGRWSARTLIPRFGTACSFGEHPMVSSAAPPAHEATMRWPTPVLCAVVAATPFSASLASHTPNPKSVTIAGSLQSELGCSGDWDPTCASTHLKFDPDDDAWQATFDVPAGNWEYKAAINGSWDENYGANAISNGANIHLDLAAPATVKFYYDHKTHWMTSNQNSVIVTAPGSYQKALGCPGDWQPDCLRSLLEDPDGDGIYKFTAAIPAGKYEVKVAINESWSENYGAGGAPNGSNIPFTVATDCQATEFTYDSVSHVLTIAPATAPAQPATVTIAGSLQSELGCAGDWDPAC